MSQPRLFTLVLVATSVLLALKGVHLAMAAGPSDAFKPGVDRASLLKEAFPDPFEGVEPDPIITAGGGGGGHGDAPPAGGGGHGAPAPAEKPLATSTERPPEAKPLPGQELLSEIAVLQKLAERRKLLEQRERELEMRESLLKATEGKIEKRIGDLKTIEESIGTAAKAKEEEKSKEIADLVKMYEAMKPKDAARVFDRLEVKLLTDIARQMNPKKLADVVAKMGAEQAEKLTVELANRRQQEAPAPQQTVRELPKIEGRS